MLGCGELIPYLPKDVVVHWAKAVDYGFHARFAALARVIVTSLT